MLNKFLTVFVILFLIITISTICYATGDILMDLSNTETSNSIIDNTTIGATDNVENEDLPDAEDTIEDISVGTDYDVSNSSELSISNIINIILIVVGIVLILLGIAIILKLK